MNINLTTGKIGQQTENMTQERGFFYEILFLFRPIFSIFAWLKQLKTNGRKSESGR